MLHRISSERPHARPRRVGLSADRIEQAALELIERNGLEAFSTRKLATELHCEAMSIYHYFPSKAHLMDALVDRVIGTELTVLDPFARDWRPRVEASAHEWRAMALRHPHFFGHLVLHRLDTPKALLWLNGIVGLFADLGAGQEAGVRMFHALRFYLRGTLLEETAASWRAASTAAPLTDDEMERSCPAVLHAGRWSADGQWEATFELGLKLMLDGLEDMVRFRRARVD